MRIGILTFHSQLNYGGVLQCWALQTALEKMGHEVVVIDRWLSADNYLLERGYNRLGFKQWIKFAIRASLGLGDINLWLRVRRTKRFLKQYIKRTQYHFVDWSAAPKDLGVDMLVVGSDQVWHCGDFGEPTVYLLDGAPTIPSIAYAASFGMTELPQKYTEIYKRGLSRFAAISCREAEGVDICRDLGFDAAHVVDPTLLAWSAGAEEKSKEQKERELVCYFLSEKVSDQFDALYAFAKEHDCKVKVFMDSAWFVAVPSNLARVKNLLKTWKRRLSSCVKIMDGAGPKEFYDAFKSASWVVSDSFHALMFSICNGCNVRMIRPSSSFRQKMFARIEEFAVHAQGPLIVDSVSSALASLANGEAISFDYDWLATRREASQSWLASSLTHPFTHS